MSAVAGSVLVDLATEALSVGVKLAIQLLGADSAKAAADAIFAAEQAAAVAAADELARAKFGTP